MLNGVIVISLVFEIAGGVISTSVVAPDTVGQVTGLFVSTSFANK